MIRDEKCCMLCRVRIILTLTNSQLMMDFKYALFAAGLSALLSAPVLPAQEIVPAGKGSYASFPPESVAYEDGYFAHPYKWFELAWDELNLHDHVRNRPIPTNDWWTEFIFRGTGRSQPEVSQSPVTVTTDDDRFGCEAWAYPHMVTASAEGFNVFFPQGFEGGGMKRGTPLRVNATVELQSADANVLYEDFESADWPEGWSVTVNSKGIAGPMATDEITQSPAPVGYTGDRFLNTFQGDDAQFAITSPAFTIGHRYIRLYVGGGNYADDTYVGLFIDGERVCYATGENSGTLRQHTWDVSAYQGRQAEIRIVDGSSAGWGFIMCDEIVFTDSPAGGTGYTPEWQVASARVYDWSDLGFTLRSEQDGRYMDATMVHGVPFVYLELSGLYPLISSENAMAAYDADGNTVENFPVGMSAFTIEQDGRAFGVHLPPGSIVHRSRGGDFQVEMTGVRHYVVVSVLPDRTWLAKYDEYARNKPGDVRYEYEYQVEKGKIVTSFAMHAVHLDTGAEGQPVLMAFLPHHYRTTQASFDYLPGAEYLLFRGRMKAGVAAEFTLNYDFGGMPPYLPEPLDLPDERRAMLDDLLDYATQHYTVNGNTYAKGLGENSTLMLMAKALGHSGYERVRDNLKAELTDWFTLDASELAGKERFFAQYPHFGAMIGFPPGYGSQGFNDLHFHNGYFAVGAARLMMVDPAFKRDFADMAKLVTQNYANWQRYEEEGDVFMPFFRTFDPYLGHSFAGGIGDGGGNNQESTSESINAWFGVYLLGVVLNDKDIIDAGATGYLLETTAAGEYWLDLYGDNFPDTYDHDYVGILRTDNLAWATYFSGDPAWVLGIQACPVDFFYTDFALQPERMEQINAAMFKDRTETLWDGQPTWPNDDPYDNIKGMGPYLGGYHLNIMNYLDPHRSSQWIDDFCRLEGTAGEEWRHHINTSTNYYMSHAMLAYGVPAAGYHTSIPSGAVYKNAEGAITYLLYNATDKAVDVNIYKGDEVIETVRVEAGQYYNSRQTEKQQPSVRLKDYREGDCLALNKTVRLTAEANDKDGQVLWVDFYVDGERIGTSYAQPFVQEYRPTVPGVKQVKLVAVDNDGIESTPCVVQLEVLRTEQRPYNGAPWQVPGETIPAVRFDLGGEGISWCDNEADMLGGDNFRAGTGVETENTADGMGNTSWTNAGEWLEYTIDVQADGVYALTADYSSASGGAFRFFIDGEDVSGSLPVEATGSWADFVETELLHLPLKGGRHIMRAMIDQTGMNVRSYRFDLVEGQAMPTEVSAGDDRVVRLPETSIALTATAATYGGAQVASFAWSQADANSPVTLRDADKATVQVSGLQAGTYVFEVRVQDTGGGLATDRVTVTVIPGNFAPIVKLNVGSVTLTAGQLGASLELDGSASYDPDGTIAAYHWEQTDHHNRLQLTDAGQGKVAVSGFEGDKLYVLQLTVTDNEGTTASGQVRIYTETPSGSAVPEFNRLSVYPNPFADRLCVNLPRQEKSGTVKLYSATGVLMMQQSVDGYSSLVLNTSRLPRGYYILSCDGFDGQRCSEVVVK